MWCIKIVALRLDEQPFQPQKNIYAYNIDNNKKTYDDQLFKRKKFLLVNLIHSSSNLLSFTKQEKEWSNIVGSIEEQRESPIIRNVPYAV